MKVFITGGTGSIGAHIVKMLCDQGHQVHVLARDTEKAKLLSFDGVKIFHGDVLNEKVIDEAVAGCQQAYHLAAFAKVWARDSGIYFDINVRGTENVLKACVKHGVQKVVVTSTAGTLGPSLNSEITEDKIRDIDFFNEYESSKAAGESKVKDYITQHGLNCVIVLPTRVYGPFLFGESSSITLMIDKYINKSWRLYPGNGTQIGNYAYIEDVALGHLLAMEKGRSGHLYLLGGENHSFKEFFKVLSEVSGVKVKLWVIPHWFQVLFAKFQVFKGKYLGGQPLITPKWIARGKYDWVLSPKKAVEELGLPITPLKEGLEKTVKRLREHQSKAK